MSRYTRDEIITQALDLAHSPTVNAHDTPGGILQPNAWSIKWLQNALDMFHRMYPFAGDLQVATSFISASTGEYQSIPANHMIGVRNGIFITYQNQKLPLKKLDYQRWLQQRTVYQSTPAPRPLVYTLAAKQYKCLPLPEVDMPAELHYFALPPEPTPNGYVDFPDEYSLIEFIRLKALEWNRAQGIPVGTAQLYLKTQLGALRGSGLLGEAEYDDGIPIENNQNIPEHRLVDRNAWMGGWIGGGI